MIDQKVKRRRLPKSLRKFIRMEKARIRRANLSKAEKRRLIKELLTKLRFI